MNKNVEHINMGTYIKSKLGYLQNYDASHFFCGLLFARIGKDRKDGRAIVF